MSSHQYQPTAPDSPTGGPDSDPDLSLDELDPLPPGSSQNGYVRAQASDSGVSAGGIQMQSLSANDKRDKRQRHKAAQAIGDIRHRRDSQSTDGDKTPLLTNDSDAEQDVSLDAMPSQPLAPSVSQILTKLRSTPRSEVEDEYDPTSTRRIAVGNRQASKYPPNLVSNAKYTPWSFLPRTLYHEFSFFLNLYFLLVALSQIIPPLRIGYLSTYVAPLAFVLTITLGKEAFDDITRRRRDAEANAERYTVLAFDGLAKSNRSRSNSKRDQRRGDGRLKAIEEEEEYADSDGLSIEPTAVREISKMSRDLKVGDIVKLAKDQRVPADLVILKAISESTNASEAGGEAFIRTDQLDGETDWKLRLAPSLTQSMSNKDLSKIVINASKPEKKVNEFVGSLEAKVEQQPPNSGKKSVSLTIDNTTWANTVVASSGTVYAAVVYTGPQTRQALSTSSSRTKTGLLEYEINSLTKILCLLTLLLSFLLVAFENFESTDGSPWYIAVMKFLILFSTIIPISLRVNLDLGKSVYAWYIHHDEDIPGAVVRTSTIPEDLGRIEYLLSDKTGTLTQNDMQLKKVHVGTVSYANDAMSEVAAYIRHGFAADSNTRIPDPKATATRSRREIGSRVRDVVLAMALCHNVTPIVEGESITTYQASSPDEIAIVRWTEAVGLRLSYRDRESMVLESSHTGQVVARTQILNMFPFTSESKRMGIILKFEELADETQAQPHVNSIWFFQKGADTVMSSIVSANDWLDEETANMAREGLRTLVIGRKRLSDQQYADFSARYKDASVAFQNRDAGMANVVKAYLEHDLELLGVTGVEDKLQQDVKPSLELLRNAHVKIWMLTGDKVETARCVAVSSKLVSRGQYVHVIAKMTRKDLAKDSLDFLHNKPDAALLIDGDSLALMLTHHRDDFISTAVGLSSVIACRCSPTQKAEVAQLIRKYTKKRICCIGDGGNDVSMIQAADVGVGIVGKEGRQASLAADFSITQFHHLTKLLMWHGRNSYKRSAKLAQFVIHRGLIIAVCQTVFSAASSFEPIVLHPDWLLVGYATVYTMAPVFSLVLDTDIPPQLAHLYPELYAELSSSRSLSYRTFFIWVAISVYQGCAIQILAQVLVGLSQRVFKRMVSVSFTALVINELVMVAAEVTTWHWIMAVSILGTAAIYFGSVPFLGRYFDLAWLLTAGFWWRLAAVDAVSLIPVYAGKILRRVIRPPNYRKVQQGA